LSGAKVDIFFGNSKHYPTFLITLQKNKLPVFIIWTKTR